MPSPRSEIVAKAAPGVYTSSRQRSTVDAEEIGRFDRIAGAWWDPNGEFGPLHKLNPCRIGYIRRQVARNFGLDERPVRAFDGLGLCDVGCGGGLVAEPLARMGFAVTGIDAGPENIAVARRHAEAEGVEVTYQVATAEDLAAERAGSFDAVLALELIEHVADPALLMGSLAGLLRPGGIAIVSTLNRSLLAFAAAKIAAEYVFRWVPVGTHDWRKFVKPSELVRLARGAGLETLDLAGMRLDLLRGWVIDPRPDINYLATFRRRS